MSMSESLSEKRRVVIVGAGQAAAQLCQSLRAGGFDGAITLIGDEAAPPYQRPPLSKAFLKGELPEERLYLRPASWYEENRIGLVLRTKAIALDRSAKVVTTASGGEHPYDVLVLATGSRPRPCSIPGATLDGVHDLRSLNDVERLRAVLTAGKRAVIVGGGYIGLETAAVARQIGAEVTLLERAPRVLERVAGPVVSTYFEGLHEKRGVRIVTSAVTEEIVGQERAEGVRLEDGRVFEADLVLLGIGILPNDELAVDAGIEPGNGIAVDEQGRTSDPSVYAIGDCAERPLFPYGGRGRLESVHNAIEQGKLAAASILGGALPRLEAPWFWSDQYDVKLQIAGLGAGYDAEILRGDPTTHQFAVFYLKDDVLVAVDAVNAPAEFLSAKRLIPLKAKPDPAALKDPLRPMKDIVAEAAAQGRMP
jgi:3-phenylpropionate/trans-cinnamate dioxygenase ferredoxin reductase subunit